MLGKESAGFLGRVPFAAGCLGEAFVEISVDSFFVAEKPVFLQCFRLNEVEGMSEEFGRLAEGSAVELALDSLLDSGVEGDDHGTSIGQAAARRKAIPAAGYMNFLRLKAATSAADNANHSPLPRFSAKRLCQ
jgi:hypothetical protein